MTARRKPHFGEVTQADLAHFNNLFSGLKGQDQRRVSNALRSLAEIDLSLGRVAVGLRWAVLEAWEAESVSRRASSRTHFNRRRKLVYAFDEAAQRLLACKGRPWPAGITAETAAAVEAARAAVRGLEAPALREDEEWFQRRKSPRGRPSSGGDRSAAMRQLGEMGVPRATARTLLALAVKADRARVEAHLALLVAARRTNRSA